MPTRTQNFHHFLKLALTKNPKKRPTAEKLLQVGDGGRAGAEGLASRGLEARNQPVPPHTPAAPVHNPAPPSGSPHTAVGQSQ